jgi:hypothetical protein
VQEISKQEARKLKKRADSRAFYLRKMASDPDYAKKKSAIYYKNNTAKKLAGSAKWASENREHRLKYNKDWRDKNPEKAKAIALRARSKTRSLCAQRSREWRAKYPERNKQMMRDWWENNPEKRAEYQSRPHVKIIRIARSRINTILRQLKLRKLQNTHDIIGGVTGQFFKQYVEAQFTPEMTWENHGSYWELDHTIPIMSFDVSIESEMLKAFHYSNCKPLKKFDNRSKGDKMPYDIQANSQEIPKG